VVAGRTIPMFTNNGIPGAHATRNPWIERLALGGVLVLTLADALAAPPLAIAVVPGVTGATHAARLLLWQPWRTFGAPLVWILHASYGWLVVHLMLRGLAAFGLVPMPLATHALTVGVIGGMTVGMMTRTARGHTGRALVAGRAESTCFVLIQLAALIRVLGGASSSDGYTTTVVASAVCWSLAFLVFAVCYWPILSRPRIDGKPG